MASLRSISELCKHAEKLDCAGSVVYFVPSTTTYLCKHAQKFDCAGSVVFLVLSSLNTAMTVSSRYWCPAQRYVVHKAMTTAVDAKLVIIAPGALPSSISPRGIPYGCTPPMQGS